MHRSQSTSVFRNMLRYLPLLLVGMVAFSSIQIHAAPTSSDLVYEPKELDGAFPPEQPGATLHVRSPQKQPPATVKKPTSKPVKKPVKNPVKKPVKTPTQTPVKNPTTTPPKQGDSCPLRPKTGTGTGKSKLSKRCNVSVKDAADALKVLETYVQFLKDPPAPGSNKFTPLELLRARGNRAFEMYRQFEGVLQIFNMGYAITVDAGRQTDGTHRWHQNLLESFEAAKHPLRAYFIGRNSVPIQSCKDFRNSWKSELAKKYTDKTPVPKTTEAALNRFEEAMGKFLVPMLKTIITKQLPKDWK